MRIDILTLFPEVFSPLFASIPARAQQAGAVELELHYLRKWGIGKHRQVDDVPFGGGPGMLLKPEPLFAAIRDIQSQSEQPACAIFLTPQGQPLTQPLVNELAVLPRLLLICGHYEGIDERVREALIDREISLGDFVLSGGELPAMVLADAVIRLQPGVIAQESYEQDSFYSGLLDHPHYTRPAEFEGMKVPEVLLSGHHEKIEKWRHQAARQRTLERRPDLIKEDQ
ncbi:MAG: tRNA (guanosine(37)-N1)-methyltransferase TrmD [Vulcanimicrobiota bacterium]